MVEKPWLAVFIVICALGSSCCFGPLPVTRA